MALDWSPITLPHKFLVPDAAELGVFVSDAVVEVSRNHDLRLVTSVRTVDRSPTEPHTLAGTEVPYVSIPITSLLRTQQGMLLGYQRGGDETVTEGKHRISCVNGTITGLELKIRDEECVAITEWLTCMPPRLWTRSTEFERKTITARTREGVLVEETNTVSGGGRDHSRFDLNLPTLGAVLVGSVGAQHVTEGVRVDGPGFIEYRPGQNGLPDEKLRRTVRRALEFLFGCGFGILGHSELGNDSRTVRVRLASPYVPGGTSQELPPALLHSQDVDAIDEGLVARFLKRYIEMAEACRLNQAIWSYLHGRNAPLDMASGYTGAAFEVLRRGYYELPENEAKSRLLPRETWGRLSKEFGAWLDGIRREDVWRPHSEALATFQGRFAEFNKVSGTKLNLLFLQDLGLMHGEIERRALRARNDAAHANDLDETQDFPTLRAYRGLHTLFSRALFAVLGVNVQYVDYSTPGFPARPLPMAQGA